MLQTIYLIRHTAPEIEKGICYGFTDIDVAASFDDELNLVKQKLENVKFSHFYSSPLQRCRVLADNLYRNVILDNRLKELNFGQMEMVAYSEMDKEWLNQWMDDFVNLQCPSGESFLQLQQRVVNFYHELQKREEPVVGIATHGGVIRSLICNLLDIPLQNAFKIAFDWGGITKITIKDGLEKVEYINR